MASEQILKTLFQTSKNCSAFKGMTDDEIWKACLGYKDRPDADVEAMMENMKKSDEKKAEQSEKVSN